MKDTNQSNSINTVSDQDRSTIASADATQKPRIGLKVRTRIKAGQHVGFSDDGGDGGGDIIPPGNHGLKVRTAL